MDKILILNELMKYKGFDSKSDFARFLGIPAQNVVNWYKRNTFDLENLILKFPEIRPLWLITGDGNMFLNQTEMNQHLSSGHNDRKQCDNLDGNPDPMPMTGESAPVLETETGKVVSDNQKTGCNTGKILPLNLLNINTSIEEYAQQNELLDYCPCDFITPFTFAYQIQSDTLYPDYNVGDWILIKKINFSEVRIGKTYFIDTRSKGKMIKRVDYNNNSLILSLPKRPWLCPILNIDKNDILSEIYGIYDIIFQLRKTGELPPTHENNDLVKQNADFIEIAKTAMHNQEKTLGLLQDTIEIIKRKF